MIVRLIILIFCVSTDSPVAQMETNSMNENAIFNTGYQSLQQGHHYIVTNLMYHNRPLRRNYRSPPRQKRNMAEEDDLTPEANYWGFSRGWAAGPTGGPLAGNVGNWGGGGWGTGYPFNSNKLKVAGNKWGGYSGWGNNWGRGAERGGWGGPRGGFGWGHNGWDHKGFATRGMMLGRGGVWAGGGPFFGK